VGQGKAAVEVWHGTALDQPVNEERCGQVLDHVWRAGLPVEKFERGRGECGTTGSHWCNWWAIPEGEWHRRGVCAGDCPGKYSRQLCVQPWVHPRLGGHGLHGYERCYGGRRRQLANLCEHAQRFVCGPASQHHGYQDLEAKR